MPNILQNRLPGVTIYDQFGHINDGILPREDNDSLGEIQERSSLYYPLPYEEGGGGYQSLCVEFPPKVNRRQDDRDSFSHPFMWVEEQVKLQRRHQQSLRWWYACCFMVFLVLWAKWCLEEDSLLTDDASVMQVLQGELETSGDGGVHNDHHRQDILRALEKLDEVIEGDIVLQSTKSKFIEAARVWRQDLELPLAVIEAKTQHDVELAVPILAGLAKEFSLQFAVRSGGYSTAGYSTIGAKGVVLSLAHLDALKWTNSTSIASDGSRTVVIEPGVRVKDFFNQVLYQNDYAGVMADAAFVGVGGFILGGGYGLLSRKYGLGVDNVVRIRIVLASGVVRDVDCGDDLFWALLGAGGDSFGVVTEIEYKVYPCGDMKLAANIRLPMEDALDFLQILGDSESTLDRNVTVRLHGFQSHTSEAIPSSIELDSISLALLRERNTWQNESLGGAGNSTTEISIFWTGDADPENPIGMNYLKKHLVSLFTPSAAENVWFYYNSWSSLSRAKEQPSAWSTIFAAQSWNGFLYAEQNTPEVWEDIDDSFLVLFRYSRHITPTIDLWRGAIADVPNNATAFPHRQALYHIRLDLLVPKEGNTTSDEARQVFEQEVALVTAIWPSICRHLKGSFVNYPMPSLSQEEYPSAYWAENLERLVTLKEQYDPLHLFRYEQSVPFKSNRSTLGR